MPDGREHFAGDRHFHFHGVLPSKDGLYVTEPGIEAIPSAARPPCAFNHCLADVLVPMGDSAGFDFSRAFLVARLEPAPGDQGCGRDEHLHVGPYFRKDGGCRTFFHAGDGLQVLVFLGERLLAEGRQPLLAFLQMLVVQFDLLAVRLDQVDVRLRDHAGQGGFQGLPAHPVHRAPVQGFHQSPGAGLALGQQPHHLLVAPAVGRGEVIADPDVASLEQGIQFGEFVHLLLVQVEDAPVVLAHALHEGFGDEASPNQVLQGAFRYPGRIPHIAFPAG